MRATITFLICALLLTAGCIFCHAQNVNTFHFITVDKRPVQISSLYSSKALLIVWNSSSTKHRLALMRINSQAARFKKAGCAVISIETGNGSLSGQQWYVKARISFPYLVEKPGGKKLSHVYRKNAKPLFLIVDRYGTVKHRAFGFENGLEFKLLSLCENF